MINFSITKLKLTSKHTNMTVTETTIFKNRYTIYRLLTCILFDEDGKHEDGSQQINEHITSCHFIFPQVIHLRNGLLSALIYYLFIVALVP